MTVDLFNKSYQIIYVNQAQCFFISWPKNKQHCTTYGNEPKGSVPCLRPKTHIQHTHSQLLSPSTQATTNDKSAHRNKIGKQNETLMAKVFLLMIGVPDGGMCGRHS